MKTNLIFVANHLRELIDTLESVHEGKRITDEYLSELKRDTAEIGTDLRTDIEISGYPLDLLDNKR